MKINEIDKNFIVKTNVQIDDIKFHNPEEKPFCIYGVFRENGRFRRMPESVAKTVNQGVFELHTDTAGGRIRFKTNSRYVVINAEMDNIKIMPHFAVTGSTGFDLYADNEFINSFVPPLDIKDGYESAIWFPDNKIREITINFPLYASVKNLFIGLQESAEVGEPSPYKNQKPIVFYGSSITQGGCASRPGTCYQSILSRKFNFDFINLGFSGNAKGEDEITDYIKDLEMSAFVLDYDHNAPSADHLNDSHEKMFKAVREKHPDIPIIMMSRPKVYLSDDEQRRQAIVKATYENAISLGDKNVYFLGGKDLTELCGTDGTVDACHPTDLGFVSMAKAIGNIFEKIEII